jgi:hypothetical protein
VGTRLVCPRYGKPRQPRTLDPEFLEVVEAMTSRGLILLLAALAASASAQVDTQRVARVVYLQGEPFTKAQQEEAWNLAAKDLVKKRMDSGWHAEERANRLFLYSPDLWRKQEIDNVLGVYRGLAKSVGPDGLVDVTTSPALRAFTASAFKAMGFNAPENVAFAVRPQVEVRLTDGSTTRVLTFTEPVPREVSQRLREKPLTLSPQGLGQAPWPAPKPDDPERVENFLIKPPAMVHVQATGDGAHLAADRATDLSMGLGSLQRGIGACKMSTTS